MAWGKRQPKGDRVHCAQLTAEGKPCRAYALIETYEDEDGPKCRTHSMSAEERSAHSRRMAQKSVAVRHDQKKVAPRASGISPDVSHRELLEIVADALQATDFLGAPDHAVRTLACVALLSGFRDYYSRDPEQVEALLRQIVPREVYDADRMKATEVYREARAAWDRVDGLRWSDLKGLWIAPYPPSLIGPHEDARKTNGRRPRPISPERAAVKRTPVGPVLERAGSFPLVLPEEEPPAGDDWPETIDTFDTGDVVAW